MSLSLRNEYSKRPPESFNHYPVTPNTKRLEQRGGILPQVGVWAGLWVLCIAKHLMKHHNCDADIEFGGR